MLPVRQPWKFAVGAEDEPRAREANRHARGGPGTAPAVVNTRARGKPRAPPYYHRLVHLKTLNKEHLVIQDVPDVLRRARHRPGPQNRGAFGADPRAAL